MVEPPQIDDLVDEPGVGEGLVDLVLAPHDLLGEEEGADEPQLFPEEPLELEEDRKPEELELGLEDENELEEEPEERP